ncbi:MAG: phosphatase PAP2 family protein [Ruminococcus sp.]|nr:phosphatase PAP2 family protein [Ruminococcus sp.]MBQ9139500.1 phosphatase PAP2 family protein [Ruminococcus sp.]
MQEIELEVLDFIRNNIRNGFLDTVMPMVTMCGNLGIFWVAVALVISAKAKYRKCSITMLIGLIIGVLIGNLVIKNAVRRDRPCWIVEVQDMLIANPQDFSFPSGHTLSSFCAAAILFHYDKKLGIPSFGVAIMIAFSRLYLYVHFPTDIIGGAILGMLVASLTINVTEKYIFKRKTKSDKV